MERWRVESGLSLVSLETKVISFCVRATVTQESCHSQVTDRLLHRGTDVLDCSSICVIM